MIELDKDNFDMEVLQAHGVVFVDFWSSKCKTCKTLLSDVEAFVAKNGVKAKFCRLDTVGNRRLSISQKVTGLPTFVFYKDGEKAAILDKAVLESKGIDAVQAKLDELLG